MTWSPWTLIHQSMAWGQCLLIHQGNSVEPMEVDPPQEDSLMAVGPPATGMTWQHPSAPRLLFMRSHQQHCPAGSLPASTPSQLDNKQQQNKKNAFTLSYLALW